MTDWTSGYVAEVDYSFGYYAELNPLRARLALLNAGLAAPTTAVACELGFGQGVSVNAHAAASTTTWWGTDFNPSHAASAREMATVSGSGANLFDDAFSDFLARADLPDFDMIGIHGVWSWVSDQNRAAIVEFLLRKLKPGGVAYISYNTLPGHSGMVPLRHMMVRHAEAMEGAGRGLAPRIDAAIAFAERLVAVSPSFTNANPQTAERLKRIRGEDRHYVAHEYFNRDWRPMHFGEAADLLAAAKLSFACSARFLGQLSALNLSADQIACLNDIPDVSLRETARDFMTNQQFRCDYFVKGPRRLSNLDRQAALRSERFLLMTPRDKVSLTAVGPVGEVALRADIYHPILDALSDHRPKAFDALLAVNPGVGVAWLLEALTVLVDRGDVAMVQDEGAVEAVGPSVRRLNTWLMSRARSDESIAVLASPLTGGGVPVSRFEKLFLLARAEGRSAPADWAAFAWACLSELAQLVIVDGKVIEDPAGNLAELTRQAVAFAGARLAVLEGAGIA